MTASYATLQAPHRLAIAEAAERLFRGHVDIDERAYRALEIAGGGAGPERVWWAAAAMFPGIATFYDELELGPITPPPNLERRIAAGGPGVATLQASVGRRP
jgi:hypothetical protein